MFNELLLHDVGMLLAVGKIWTKYLFDFDMEIKQTNQSQTCLKSLLRIHSKKEMKELFLKRSIKSHSVYI